MYRFGSQQVRHRPDGIKRRRNLLLPALMFNSLMDGPTNVMDAPTTHPATQLDGGQTFIQNSIEKEKE